MQTIRTAILAAALFLLATGVAGAGPFGPDSEARENRMIAKITEQLELNEEQRAKLQQFVERRRAVHKAKEEKDRERREELLSLLDAPRLDQARAAELFKEKQQAANSCKQGMIPIFAQFSDSLSQAQRQKLKAILAKRMERRGGNGKPPWAD